MCEYIRNHHPQANRLLNSVNELQVPADCVIIDGEAIVNEASQTGESVPRPKTAIRDAASVSIGSGGSSIGSSSSSGVHAECGEEILSFTKHHAHILCCGTEVVQVVAGVEIDDSDDTNEEVSTQESPAVTSTEGSTATLPSSTENLRLKCLVLKTGSFSSQGELVHKLQLASSKGDSEKIGGTREQSR
jgi:magnesium-transporting ATPase (P-type)